MIGVFDSGIGGLSVLKEIDRQIADCAHIYIADSGFTPYGDRDPEEIIERSLKIVHALESLGCRIVVVACNTATAIAVNTIRQQVSIPVVAMEPAIKPAVKQTRKGRVGILATSKTLSSERYARLLEKFAEGAEVIDQPCTGLVEQIENLQIDSAQTQALLQKYLQPMLDHEVDTLVLGCTHYPFLTEQINRITGRSVNLIDTAIPVTHELKRQLEKLDKKQVCSGSKRYLTTGDVKKYQKQLDYFWPETVEAEFIRID